MSKIIGYPHSPKIFKPANCGPFVLAAALGIHTDEAMQLMDSTYNNGWNGFTNVGHIRAALRSKGIDLVKTKIHDNNRAVSAIKEPTLVFIQIEGGWMGKGWIAEYTRTHWAMFHKCLVMDINNPLNMQTNQPKWITPLAWNTKIMKFLVRTYPGTGWHVRSSYELIETGGT